jgi:primosomal protein N' (replication factor Y)
MNSRAALVALPGIDGAFSYLIPSALKSQVVPGVRVLIPFRSRRVTGFVTEVSEEARENATRSIEQTLDNGPALNAELLRVTKWVSEYYLSPWGDAMRAAIPGGIDAEDQFKFCLGERAASQLQLDESGFPREVQDLLDALQENPLTARQVKKNFALNPDGAEIRGLKQRGLIEYRAFLQGPRVNELIERVLHLTDVARDALADESLFAQVRTKSGQRLIRELRDGGEEGVTRSSLLKGASKNRREALSELLAQKLVREERRVVSRWKPDALNGFPSERIASLTDAQSAALERLSGSLETKRYEAFLLFGVTGSGKTRVYIEAIERALSLGRTALVLVPEIALTPQLWGRFRAAFGERVAIQHSAQAPAERYDLWRAIAKGEFPVVIGARSAVFAPLENLGVVVVDEEHESSYKQNDSVPRYSGRDVALYRAQVNQCVAILGSATPSLESLYAVEKSKLMLLTLPHRVAGAQMPRIEIVAPASQEENSELNEPESHERVLSKPVREAMTVALSHGKQIILLQNRRGYAPFLICDFCGKVQECPNCAVSLTYHRPGRILRCHYCNHRDDAPDRCPSCGSLDLSMSGIGTQKLEEEISTRFPQARVARMDSDAMSRIGAHAALTSAFQSGEYDILAGTQMVAKGLDFPNVELAVVAQADTELFHPDFRASEKGASLMLQLAGRAGRASENGHVMIQTSAPEHAAVKAVLHGDWLEFARNELPNREKGRFPPYYRVILLRALATDEDRVAKAMLILKRKLESHRGVELLGPAPCAVAKIANRYRYSLIARTSKETDHGGKKLRHVVKSVLDEVDDLPELQRVQIEVDVDPLSLT